MGSILFQNVDKVFGPASSGVKALDNINLEIAEKEFVAIVGPSGCGKTTCLRMVAGFEAPSAGLISVSGKKVTEPGPDRAVVFQQFALFPWKTVRENIELGLRNKNLPAGERNTLVESALKLMNLETHADAFPHQLSGGMQQRVAIARALVHDPKLVLMDEPFGALDALTREQLYGDIQRIWQQRKKTIVFVTHNVREAACLGDRVVLFSPHPGRIREQFKIDLPRPRDINSVELARHTTAITAALKNHVRPEAEVAE